MNSANTSYRAGGPLEQAACLDDPRGFDLDHLDPAGIALAVETCLACPVLDACRTITGSRAHPPVGVVQAAQVWGGKAHQPPAPGERTCADCGAILPPRTRTGTLSKARYCDACRKTAGKARPIRHGTDAGYRAHHRRGEPACTECLDAGNAARWTRTQRRAA